MPFPGTTGAAGGGGSFGLPPTNWSAAYGGVPSIPNPGVSASSAIGANINNLGSLKALGSGIDAFNTVELRKSLATNLPNYEALNAQSSKNILSHLQGQVPDDVVNQILQQAAERGIITGTTGSSNADTAMLRVLGLTSLDLMGKGEQEFSGAVARTPVAKPWDITNGFVSPDQWQEAAYAASVAAAAPNPMAAGTAAYGAASSGLNKGLGSIGSAPTISGPPKYSGPATSWSSSNMGYSEPPQVVGYANPGGYDHQPTEPTQDPYSAYQNWLRSLPTDYE